MCVLSPSSAGARLCLMVCDPKQRFSGCLPVTCSMPGPYGQPNLSEGILTDDYTCETVTWHQGVLRVWLQRDKFIPKRKPEPCGCLTEKEADQDQCGELRIRYILASEISTMQSCCPLIDDILSWNKDNRGTSIES